MNTHRNIDVFNALLIFDICCVFFILLFTIVQQNTLVSLIFSLTFISSFGLFLLRCLLDRKDIYFALSILIMLFALINVMITNQGMPSFEYFKKLIIFFCSVQFIEVTRIVRPSKKSITALKTVVLASGLLFVFFFYVLKLRTIYKTSNLLSMNFTNPNLLGMWLLLIFLLLIACLIKSNSNLYRFVASIICILLVPIMIKCDARNVLFSLVFTPVFFLFTKTKRNTKLATVFVILFPILFVIFYLLSIDIITKIDFLQFVVSEGKQLDSRFYIWSRLIDMLKSNFIFGNYYSISGGTGNSQCCNTHLDILCSYGVFVYSMTIAILMNRFWEIGKYISSCSYKDRIVYAIAVCVTLIGVGEAALFSGGIGIYIFAFIPSFLINYDNKEAE